jgi:hypothetical protein
MVLLGLMQLGKTSNFTAIMLFLPVIIQLIQKKLVIPLIECPSDNNILLQVQTELVHVMALYGMVEVAYQSDNGVQRKSLCQYYQELSHHTENGSTHISDLLRSLVIARNRGWHKRFSDIMSKLEGRDDLMVIQFVDECQEGTQVDQSFHNWTKPFRLESSKVITFWVSASPDQALAGGDRYKDQYKVCKQYVPPSYVGPRSYCGHSLPTLVKCDERLPEIRSYEKEYAAIVNDLDADRFREGEPIYQRRFARAILAIATDCLSTKSPIFFIRPFGATGRNAQDVSPSYVRGGIANCDRLVDLLRDQIRRQGLDIHVLPFYDQLDKSIFGDQRAYGRRKTIKEVLVEQYAEQGKRVIVVSCSRSRRGDSYPKECGYMMDMVETHCSWNTFLQSTFGRACGHNKTTVLLFQNKYKEELELFLKQKCHSTTKPFSPATQHTWRGPRKDGRPRVLYETLVFDKKDADYRGDHQLAIEIKTKLDHLVNHALFKAGNRKSWHEMFHNMFDARFQGRLWSEMAIKMMAWGEHIGTNIKKEQFRNSQGNETVYVRWYADITQWDRISKKGGAMSTLSLKKGIRTVNPLLVLRTLPGQCPTCGGSLNQNMKDDTALKSRKRGRQKDARQACCRVHARNEVIAVRFVSDVSKPRDGKMLDLSSKAALPHLHNFPEEY